MFLVTCGRTQTVTYTSRQSTHQLNLIEPAFHFCRSGLSSKSLSGIGKHSVLSSIMIEYGPKVFIICYVRKVANGVTVFKAEKTWSDIRFIPRLEQKLLNVSQGIMQENLLWFFGECRAWFGLRIRHCGRWRCVFHGLCPWTHFNAPHFWERKHARTNDRRICPDQMLPDWILQYLSKYFC